MKGVLALVKSPRVVLVSWVHFLAFDLVVGLLILADSASHGFDYWWVVPSLLFTLMWGPVGLLSYLGLRLVPV